MKKQTAPSEPEKTGRKRPARPRQERPSRNKAKKAGAATPVASKAAPAQKSAFSIIGIGASAGGLEAIERFFSNVPDKPGMAFVIVQHLDPDYKGVMPELLQRMTPLKVRQVTDRTRVVADCVYIIPPNRDMSLLHGYLHLIEPKAPRGLRLPIDFFFSSLADDMREKSIGIILSGMGSDGTAGLRRIHEEGGLSLVQDPATAKFDGMPHSAIDAGLADIVVPPEEMPQKIAGFIRFTPLLRAPKITIEPRAKSALEKIFILMRTQTGHDFSLYKKSMMYRRIERRMGIHQIDRIATYVRFLQENPREVELLFKELLIGVTGFFRDPAVWDHLRDEILPRLIDASPDGRALRAWVAGCSTGEEAYSLAMVFAEAVAEKKPKGRIPLQIYATDLDADAIDRARIASYPAGIAANVSAGRLNRFFKKEENGGYRIATEIREMVIFARQNLIMDPPFTKIDILCCRNLLIYFEPELQKKLVPLFNYALNPGGILILGNAETIGGNTGLFSPLEPKMKIYVRKEPVMLAKPVEFPTAFFPTMGDIPAAPRPGKPVNLQALADQILLQDYSPSAVMTNDAGDILYIHGRTGKYLEPPAGKANWNLFAMAREGLRYDLNHAFQQVVRKRKTVRMRSIRMLTENGTREVDVTVQLINEPPELNGNVLVVLSDTAPAAHMAGKKGKHLPAEEKTGRITDLERELQRSREDMQSMREEMQTSQEELKSTNEELQSTNEELQSTNEELTTSKEELQSLNEELETVNTELRSRVEDLSTANNDMKNLLNSTDIATLFLDEALHVRRFTARVSRIIRLIPTDVGRPITDISSDLIYPELPNDAREVLRTLVFSEKIVPTKDGRTFSVKIMPYRTMDNKIDGVVITLLDVTFQQMTESELGRTSGIAEALAATLHEAVIILDGSMNVVSVNNAFFRKFRVPEDEVIGRPLFALGNGQWDIPRLRELLETILPQQATFENFKVEHDFPVIGHCVMLLNARRIKTAEGGTELILLAIEDLPSDYGG